MYNLENIPTDELRAELNRRDGLEAERKLFDSLENLKNYTLGGFKTSDFKVVCSDNLYSFYLSYKDKSYCIYYDSYDDSENKRFHTDVWAWWPRQDGFGLDDDDAAYYGVRTFIPSFMIEVGENCYQSAYNLTTTVEYLKLCGFSNIEIR